MGIGISTYGEICAFGPSPATPAGGWESATVKIDPAGKVTVMTGASPHGQGEETTFAQIAADELGVDMDDVIVLHGDTAVVQYGIGTFGSRGTAVGGPALYFALQELKEKIKKFGAMLLGVGRCDLCQAEAASATSPANRSSLAQIAAASYRALKLPPGEEPGLQATYFWEPPNFTFPFGAHIAVTEVDRETGQVDIMRYVAVDDCGNIINPLLVDGQVHGGVVQGIGQALYEQAVYDDNGQLISGELMDYAIPKATMMPWIESSHTVTPSPVNPLGVKGVGEAGTIGCVAGLGELRGGCAEPAGRAAHRYADDAGKDLEAAAAGRSGMIAQNFEYSAPDHAAGGLAVAGRRHGQGAGGRHEPDPDDEAAAGRAGAAGGSEPSARAERRSPNRPARSTSAR